MNRNKDVDTAMTFVKRTNSWKTFKFTWTVSELSMRIFKNPIVVCLDRQWAVVHNGEITKTPSVEAAKVMALMLSGG